MATMNSIRATFFEECEELLEALAEGLALMAEGAHDAETVNAVFRAVHSVKGGAGAFALDALVAFAHRFETVLDGIRSDRIELTPDVMHTLLRSADHLADQVEAARDGAGIDAGVTAGFLTNLDLVLGGPPVADPVADADPCFGFSALPLDFGAGLQDLPAAEGGYLIRFRPYPALFANGHDPALILAALSDLGMTTVELDSSALPPWADFDPAGSYLGWTIRLTTAEPETVLHEVFEFVEGLCALDIAPAPATLPAAAADPIPATPPPVLRAEPSASPPAADPPPRKREAKAAEDEGEGRGPKPTLRVDLERVDRLINAVGELIINQAMIEQSISVLSLPADAEVIAHVEDYRLLARDIRGGGDGDPRPAGEAAVPADVPHRARSGRCHRQAGASDHPGRGDRGRQDGDRKAGRSADPYDPQCRRSWAGGRRNPRHDRQGPRRHHPLAGRPSVGFGGHHRAR
ncbi:hypothetical protein MASR1M32_23430 [Rhodobacter sp.]